MHPHVLHPILRLGPDKHQAVVGLEAPTPPQTLGLSSELFTANVAKGHGDWSSPSIVTVLEDIVGLKLADLAAQQPKD